MRCLPKIFIIFIGLLVFSNTVFAAPNDSFPITGSPSTPQLEVFDRNFIALMKKWSLPGAAVVIMRNGQIVAQRGYGWADMTTRTPVQPNSLFRIASASKTFTATTVLKLIQEGKLNPNAKVFTILNDLPPLPGRIVNPKIYQITVLNLLQMSSGWFNPGAGHFDPLFGPWPSNFQRLLSPELPASCETTVRYMMSMPLKYKPGSTFVYSNLDYCLLGLVINKVTGFPYGYNGYERYVKSQILAPLNIQDMFIGSTQLKYRLPNEVRYYRDSRAAGAQEIANSFYLPYSATEILKKNFANGGWVASAIDLATFVQALNHGKILNTQTLTLMQSKSYGVRNRTTTYYTIGGIISYIGDKRYWIQTGSFTGTNALIVTKPDDTTIAVIFNTRPSIATFLSRFRPELKRLLINSDV